MAVGLLTRGLILGATAFAVGVMLEMLLRFLRQPELVKAKMFLNYNRFSWRFLLLIIFAFIAETFTWLYTLAGGAPAPTFESWGGFFQNQTLTLVVAAVIGTAFLWLRRMVR